MEVARSKNTTPLPTVKPHCGIRLPPDRYCLSACNYKLKNLKKPNSKLSMNSSTSSPRMGGVLGGRTVVRPNSPAVRVQVPRPVVKVNTHSAAAATGPKIQISVPAPSINLPPPEMEDNRGIKREREDDDYDAP